MKSMVAMFCVALAAILPVQSIAQTPASGKPPFLNPLFMDNMVLQREKPVPIWGWTTPGQKVTVQVAGKSASAVADAQGQWRAKLAPLPVGGPYTLTVSGPENVRLTNILVGDVWVCSGQSNMEMGIGNVNNAEQEIAQADYPQIRLFTVPKHVALATQPTTLPGGQNREAQWLACSPDNIRVGDWAGFSAVGYFFGRALYRNVKVPIGLIHTSWGGTPAEAWTSAEALAAALPEFRPSVTALEEARTSNSALAYAQRLAAWYAKNDTGSQANLQNADADVSNWKSMNLPTNWEKAGLPDYDGVVWFHKEITLPDGAAGKAGTLHLGPIDDMDTTWVNGVRVGGLERYDLSRDYKLPAGVLKAGRNVIAVRVLDTGGDGGIWGKPEQMTLEVDGNDTVSLAGPWLYKATLELKSAPAVPQNFNGDQNAPTVLYNGMIAPLIPYGIKGAIWYQGESNAGRAYQYRTLLPTMIKDWRTRWNQGDFPFYIVQLANFMAHDTEPRDDAWPELREAQMLTAEHVSNSGQAVIIDIGDEKDIHPKDKQDVGERLALVALARTYGQKIEYYGPLYKSMKVEGDKIRLSFIHQGGGLVARGGDKLTGFAIAGEDKKFVWADAIVDGETVVVSAPQVSHPVAVRYAWSNNPVCNLYNQAGLPASPFRTDTWPGVTLNSK